MSDGEPGYAPLYTIRFQPWEFDDPGQVERLFGACFEMRRYQPARRGPFTPAFYEMAHRRP